MQPHIECKKGDINPIVLLPGDPGRIELIASFLEDVHEVANHREFRTVNGLYKGIPVTVTSTGIGCPSTAIAVEELIACGAKTLIRVGTCGGAWRADIAAGSVIVPTASIRDEGTTKEFLPDGFPAVADLDIVQALSDASEQLGVSWYRGINRTHDAFYAPDRSTAKWGEFYQDERYANIPSPILSSEMESSALFIVAALRGVRAGAIFAVDADPTPLKAMALRETYLPNEAYKDKATSQEVQRSMIQIALEAAIRLSKDEHKS